MDELELLKNDWQKDNANYPKLTYDEIYKMLLKKSSSIVKWIFIISILEFIFWTLISFFLEDANFNKKFQEYEAKNIMLPIMLFGYIIIVYFLVKFFMNYKTISVTDNAKILMENILKTRRTVKQYVAVNLGFIVISTVVMLSIQFNRDQQMISIIDNASANGELFKFYSITIIITLISLGAAVGVLLLFYYLIYGILLKRLNNNYEELKKLEV
jgi:uncharacterized membrane protein YhdT